MPKYILKREDIDNQTDEYIKAMEQAITNCLDDILYHSNIDINNYISITSINEDDIDFKIDLPIDEKFLLSFGNPENLDGAYFDVEALIWNEIVLDDEKQQEYNRLTIEQENIFDLFYEIEQEIINSNLDIQKDFKTIDLISLIDIDWFIDTYFNFKNDVDIDTLKDFIEDGINGLDDWLVYHIKQYFQSDDYYNLIDDIEYGEEEYMLEEINENGFIEVYI